MNPCSRTPSPLLNPTPSPTDASIHAWSDNSSSTTGSDTLASRATPIYDLDPVSPSELDPVGHEIDMLVAELKVSGNHTQESAKALLFYAISCHGPAMGEGSRLLELDARGVWDSVLKNLRISSSTLHAIMLLRRLLGEFGGHQLRDQPLKTQTPSDNLGMLASLLGATYLDFEKSFQVEPLLEASRLFKGSDIGASIQKYTKCMPKLFLAPPPRIPCAEKLSWHLNVGQLEGIAQFHKDMVQEAWVGDEHPSMSLALWTGRTNLTANTRYIIWDCIRQDISCFQQSMRSHLEKHELAVLLVVNFCFQALAPPAEAPRSSGCPLQDWIQFCNGKEEHLPDLSGTICLFYRACLEKKEETIREFVGSFHNTAFNSIRYDNSMVSGIATGYWARRMEGYGYGHETALTFVKEDAEAILDGLDDK